MRTRQQQPDPIPPGASTGTHHHWADLRQAGHLSSYREGNLDHSDIMPMSGRAVRPFFRAYFLRF